MVSALPDVAMESDKRISANSSSPLVATDSMENTVVADASSPRTQSSSSDRAPASPPSPPSQLSPPDSLQGLRLFALVFALCLSAFLVGLDQSIITTAIPRITAEFESQSDIGWYGSSYLLTSCAFQPIFGQLYAQFGARAIFADSFGIFLLGSLVCALAPTSTALIVGRALAGVGCAGIISGNLNIIAKSAPLEKRPLYIAWVGGMFGVALACGPLVGGAFTSMVTWQWCFWINLPIGAAVLAVVLACYRPPRRNSKSEVSVFQRIVRLDWVGAVLILTAVIMVLLALQWGGVEYPWSDRRIIGLLVGGGIEAIVFVVWQWRRGPKALVPLHVLRNRTVAFTTIAGFFQSGATFVPIFYLPYWFQVVLGASSVQSGVNLVPFMIGNFVAAMAAGFAVTKTGWYNPFLLLGPAIGAIGAGLLVTLTPTIETGKWIGYQILMGVGLGAARQQYFVAPQAVLPPSDISTAVSFVLFSQNLGASVFVSVGNALIRNSLSDGLAMHPNFAQLGSANLTNADILAAGPTEIRGMLSMAQLDIFAALYNTALQEVWILAIPLAALAALAALPMKWVNLKAKRAKAAAQVKGAPVSEKA